MYVLGCIAMNGRVLLVTCVCVLASMGLGGMASHYVIKERISEEAREELDAYMSDMRQDIHEALIGEKYHQTHDFRVDLDPEQYQCYYQEADVETVISVNFECVDPPTFASKARITAEALLPGGGETPLASIEEQRMGDFEIKAEKEGIYAFCFENKHGSSPAMLQIAIDIWRESEIAKFHESRMGTNNTEYQTYGKLFSVLRSVAVIRSAISHTRSQLRYDYLTRMSSLSRINNFSVLSVVLIISVCFLQLRVVKKMFGTQKTVV